MPSRPAKTCTVACASGNADATASDIRAARVMDGLVESLHAASIVSSVTVVMAVTFDDVLGTSTPSRDDRKRDCNTRTLAYEFAGDSVIRFGDPVLQRLDPIRPRLEERAVRLAGRYRHFFERSEVAPFGDLGAGSVLVRRLIDRQEVATEAHGLVGVIHEVTIGANRQERRVDPLGHELTGCHCRDLRATREPDDRDPARRHARRAELVDPRLELADVGLERHVLLALHGDEIEPAA